MFNGHLFEAPTENIPKKMKCALANVTLTTAPSTAFSMLKNFLNGAEANDQQALECSIQICDIDSELTHVKLYKNVS